MEINETFNTERVRLNLDALSELKKPTPDRLVLENYSGWGGLRDAVYHRDTYRQLKRLLSDSEITALKETFRSAYYTPENLVGFVYEKLGKWTISPQRILEPSAGHGVFVKKMPPSWKGAQCVAVEMDGTSCRLLRALYPDVDVRHQGFENFINDEEGFDLIIGNPPYGQINVKDEQHPDLTHVSIHHYFVGKCMRLLKPDGFLAMVLPRYFLDAPEKHVRHIIAKEGGSLVEAYRLPDDLFDDAKVTVDVVILQKRAGNTRWVNARTVREGVKRAQMNTYFFQHPEQVMGKIEFITVYGRDELTCKRTEKSERLLGADISNPTTALQSALTKEESIEDSETAEKSWESGYVVSPTTTHSVSLQDWQTKLEKQLGSIEEKKQALAQKMTLLEKEESECRGLLLTLHEHCLQWQSLCKALTAIEAQATKPSSQHEPLPIQPEEKAKKETTQYN
ncbi:MAG: N-6 DNA methylase [Legionellales bacterium]|nr:N-6 DNA methylase [Legionellales bacterium]